jgi:hypothetical protein
MGRKWEPPAGGRDRPKKGEVVMSMQNENGKAEREEARRLLATGSESAKLAYWLGRADEWFKELTELHARPSRYVEEMLDLTDAACQAWIMAREEASTLAEVKCS